MKKLIITSSLFLLMTYSSCSIYRGWFMYPEPNASNAKFNCDIPDSVYNINFNLLGTFEGDTISVFINDELIYSDSSLTSNDNTGFVGSFNQSIKNKIVFIEVNFKDRIINGKWRLNRGCNYFEILIGFEGPIHLEKVKGPGVYY